MKKVVATLLLFIFCLELIACGGASDLTEKPGLRTENFVYDEAPVADLKWDISEDGTLTISGNGKMSDDAWYAPEETPLPWYERSDEIKKVVINEGITTVSNYAFIRCESLTSVSLPNTLKAIGYRAFYGCKALSEISIPESVVQISGGVFKKSGVRENEKYMDGELCYVSGCLVGSVDGCDNPVIKEGTRLIAALCFDDCSFETINVPASVEHIGFQFTGGIDSLKSVSVAEGNKNYVSVDGVLYTKDMKTLVLYPAAKGDSFVIPDGVTTIEAMACIYLKTVTIPASVKNIRRRAFSSLDKVSYLGTEEEWNAITVEYGNETLNDAKNGTAKDSGEETSN